MGNISFIIPKENIKDLTVENIVKLITEHFRNKLKIQVELHHTGQIIVRDNNERTVCELWIRKDGCYLLTETEESNSGSQGWWKKLNDLNLSSTEPCIGSSYGDHSLTKERSKILTFLTKHFKGYWLDEGIHPEFITYNEQFLEKYVIK